MIIKIDNDTSIYVGKKYKLHYAKVPHGTTRTHMIISDMNNRKLFCQFVGEIIYQSVVVDSTNTTTPILFEKLICILLNLGFEVKDIASIHDIWPMKTIRRMVNDGNIDAYTDPDYVKFMPYNHYRSSVRPNNYRWSGRGNLPLLEAYPLFEGQDAFEGIDNHFDLNESFDELFKEQA